MISFLMVLMLLQARAVFSEPASTVTLSATFNTIPDQMYVGGLFQVIVTVQDNAAAPQAAAGSRVTLRLDPDYAGSPRHKVTLRDASGSVVQELAATAGDDGKALFWVRLSSNSTPFKARLTATAERHQQTSSAFQSNVFKVYSADNYQNY